MMNSKNDRFSIKVRKRNKKTYFRISNTYEDRKDDFNQCPTQSNVVVK